MKIIFFWNVYVMAGIQKEVKVIFYFCGQLWLFPSNPFLVVDISYFFFNFFAFPNSSSVRRRGTFSLRAYVLSNNEVLNMNRIIMKWNYSNFTFYILSYIYNEVLQYLLCWLLFLSTYSSLPCKYYFSVKW